MDGVLLRTVLSTYIHKDHVFRDIEKDLRKMAKGILAYAVEAIAYCCGCAADSCGLSPAIPSYLSPAIPSYPQLSPALSAAQPQHIRSTSAAHLYSQLLPSLSTDATLSIDGAPPHRRHHGAAISLTRPPAPSSPSPSVIVDRRY